MNKLQDEKLPETLEGGEITSYEIDSNNDPIIPEIRLFDDLIIDEEGVEYKGERIDDAGKVYWALLQVLYDREPNQNCRQRREVGRGEGF